MTRLRLFFLLQRSVGYLVVLGAVWYFNPPQSEWVWSVTGLLTVWACGDHLKRPDESKVRMQRGVWLETLLILALIGLLHSLVPGFLLISPVARASIHRGWSLAGVIGALSLLSIWSFSPWISHPWWVPVSASALLVTTMIYAGVLGELVRERDNLRRLVALDAADRERRARDAERSRMAIHLHDTQGQAWTAVLRALDVAMRLEGEQKVQFLERARNAAQAGLRQMRAATHDWYQGQRTAERWVADAVASLNQIREMTGVDVHLSIRDIPWELVHDAPDVAELLANTMRETSTNAIRHGHANQIRVDLCTDQEVIQLAVEDDGHGKFSVAESPGLGLLAIETTVKRLHGTMLLEGVPGRGTLVLVKVPYQRTVDNKSEGGVQ